MDETAKSYLFALQNVTDGLFFLSHAGIKDQRTILFYISCNKNFPVYFFFLRRMVTFFSTQLRV